MEENILSELVIGEAIQVHRELGPGLLEKVYKECLAHALIQRGLRVEQECPVPVVYHGKLIPCAYRLDLLIENRLVIEVKSVDQLNDVHFAQLLTYLKLGHYNLGLLMNFNVLRIKDGCRRIINSQAKN